MDISIALCDGTEILIDAQSLAANNMRLCHSHERYELYYLKRGNRVLFADGHFYLLREGDLFLIPPKMRHRTLDEGGGYEKLVLMLPPALLASGAESALRIVRPAGAEKEIPALADRILQAARDDALAGRAECLACVMRLIFYALSLPQCREAPIASPALGKIAEVLDYIEECYAEKISLSLLSERFFISEYYLCRIFKQYTGQTVNEYLTKLRLRAAERRLLQGEGVHGVWRACGFGSVAAFTRVFRQKNGCSAGEFAKRIGQKHQE